jgi:hypothetical protein
MFRASVDAEQRGVQGEARRLGMLSSLRAGIGTTNATTFPAGPKSPSSASRGARMLAKLEMCADNLRFFAGAGRNMDGKAAGEYVEGHTSYIRREPVGVNPASTTSPAAS